MGLDMYLRGNLFQAGSYENQDTAEKRHGHKIRDISVELGYWRKHPDLHGFIVETFAEGRDECQEIELTAGSLAQIEAAIVEGRLAHGTEGFFFGGSPQPGQEPPAGEEPHFWNSFKMRQEEDLRIIRGAIAWLKERKAEEAEQHKATDGGKTGPVWWPGVVYQASW